MIKKRMKSLAMLLLSVVGCIAVSCSSSQIKPTTKEPARYEVTLVGIVNDIDTTQVNEFRMLKPKGAHNTSDMMTKHYGEPMARYEGLYQGNIKRQVWKNIPLLGDHKTYTVITDGVESRTAYFTSLIIFDQDQKDGLASTHPDRAALLAAITEKMIPYKW